jgi:hypothetical protein
VDDIFFGIGLVEVFLVILVVGVVEVVEVVDGGIVKGVLFFEVLVKVLLVGALAGARAGDVVDGHLAEHCAEVGGALEGLLFFEVLLIVELA